MSAQNVTAACSVTLTRTEAGGVVLDKTSGTYYKLNVTGAELLSRVQEGEPISLIVTSLKAQFPAHQGRIEADVMAAIDELAALGLVRRG